MPLNNLFKPSETINSGLVTAVLMGGQYRVNYKGRPAVAISQAGSVPAGSHVTIAETDLGLVIVSVGLQSANSITEVTISG